jgi:hypothetical protein
LNLGLPLHRLLVLHIRSADGLVEYAKINSRNRGLFQQNRPLADGPLVSYAESAHIPQTDQLL